MTNSITANFKTWKNDNDGYCTLFDINGKSLAHLKGRIESIGGYLYVVKDSVFYDIIQNNDNFKLEEHHGGYPILGQ